MMNVYMVDIDLPEQLDEEFLELLPLQRKHIADLLSKGVITSYSMDRERSKIWITVNAETEREVGEIVAYLPLSEYFVLSVHILDNHETIGKPKPPRLSLN
ncbi:MAG TPA: hypothetical protein VIK89_15700 [Cytophagaceae bacterium]